MTENDKPRGQIKVEGVIPDALAAVMVYATFPDLAAAEAVGRDLIEAGHAGCINIIPGMVSLYVWEGALERSEEVVLIAKTTPGRAQSAMTAIHSAHPYETPAVLALPVAAGGADYLAWIRGNIDAAGTD